MKDVTKRQNKEEKKCRKEISRYSKKRVQKNKEGEKNTYNTLP